METKNWIGGQWVASEGGLMPVINPANAEVIGHSQASTRTDIQSAIAAAQAAFDGWKRTPAPKRARFVRKVWELAEAQADDLARLMTAEMGKPFAEARGEILKGDTLLDWYAGEGMRLMGVSAPSELANNFLYTIRKPLGVVAIITPWNFPWALPCWKIAPALVAGNTVVFKPAENTPLLSARLCELFEKAGLPAGVLNMVTGRGEVVGDELAQNPGIKGISFTGSTEVGKRIHQTAAPRLAKVSLELGGKNACVVMDDADLDLALEGVSMGAFGSAGQRCTATSRLIVHEAVADELVSRLAKRADSLRVGPGTDPATQIGPVVNATQYKRILEYIEIGKSEAKLVAGGFVPAGLEKGYFVQPTLFDHCPPKGRIAQEEIFGPVLAVFRVKSYEEALALANDTVYGLSSAIYTRDINQALRFVDGMDAGMVHINSATVGGEAQIPFGGIKNSGYGDREMSKEGLHFFTEQMTVFVDYTGAPRTSKIY